MWWTRYRARSLANNKYLFIFGQILHGIGAAPLIALGTTLLDESVSRVSAPLYIGIFQVQFCIPKKDKQGDLFMGIDIRTDWRFVYTCSLLTCTQFIRNKMVKNCRFWAEKDNLIFFFNVVFFYHG